MFGSSFGLEPFCDLVVALLRAYKLEAPTRGSRCCELLTPVLECSGRLLALESFYAKNVELS